MNQLNEKELEKVSGGNGEIIDPVTVSFSGNNLTVSSTVTVKGFHIDICYNGVHHGFPSKGTNITTYTFKSVYMTAPVKFTVKVHYLDGTKKSTSFDDPSETFTCTF